MNRSRTVRYLQLILCVGMVLFFMGVVAPGLKNIPGIKTHILFIEEHDIDAGAMYYTEIEEFSDAEVNIVNSISYSPKDFE